VKGTPQEKDFARLDKNNDGKLSRQELETATGATGGSGAAGSAAPRPAEPKTSK
jgi:Ca2+-binding EF-hand superfamily protein